MSSKGNITTAVLVTEAPLKTNFYDKALNLTVLITGLGYFIDTFDFFLYNSMRTVSLNELGLSGDALTKAGIIILNSSILGALIGSFFWGVLGDKIGRKKPLLASILIYSLFMVFNGCVHDIPTYVVIRFIIGFGLAGEIGLGATLVAETIKSSKRTYALALFTAMGVLGVLLAGTSIEFVSWRISCIFGGVLGLLLLTLRSILFESPAFIQSMNSKVKHGSLKDLLGNIHNLKKFAACVPILGCNFFITGILLTLSPEIAKALGIVGVVKANIALPIYFSMAAVGDLMGAWLSETFKSRKIVTASFILGNLLVAILLLQGWKMPNTFYYFMCGTFGLFNLWAMAATVVVEQYPTELRATAVTSNFNCSRATIILMNLAVLAFKPLGIIKETYIIGAVVFALAFFCIWRLPESYGRSLTEI
jgi:MFS transporter, putative metabolite:H+ symporter